MIKLNNVVKVFIPKADNDGNALNFSSELGGVIDVAGGATVFNATGLWNDNNKTYKDMMQVAQINAPELSIELFESIQKLSDSIFINGKQEAVSIEVNGTLYILENTEDFYELQADCLQLN
jgi:hypothetical protein